MPPPVTPHWTYMGCNALNTGVRTMAGISVAVWDRNCPGVGGTIPILPLHFIYLFIYLFIYHLFGCLFVIYLFVIYLFIYSLSIYLFIYLIAIVYYHYLFTCYLPFFLGFFQKCRNTAYLLHIMFIFGRCHRSLAAVTPARYERDSTHIIDNFMRVQISILRKK